MSKDKALEAYNKKRDFSKTSEPRGELESSSGSLKFFVQQHAASRLHYDFRLEFGGSLKSWAVPKGPSLNPLDQRLAVHVEDHPLAYGSFEGKIPPGNYGAGTVLLWDRGTYLERSSQGREDSEVAMQEAYTKGQLTFILSGTKLCGEFALIRLKDANSWLLLKKRDDQANYKHDILIQDRSVLSGLRLRQLELVDETDIYLPKKSHASRKTATAQLAKPASKDLTTAKPIEKLARQKANYGMIRPILGNMYEFDSSWTFYTKNPCYRALIHTGKWGCKIYSYTKLSFKDQFPQLFEKVRKIQISLVFECEILVYDEKIQEHSWDRLQSFKKNADGKLRILLTDLLVCERMDLRLLPFHQRLEQLKKLDIFDDTFSLKQDINLDHLSSTETREFRFLAKHLNSIYKSGVSSAFLECMLMDSLSKNAYRSQVSQYSLSKESQEDLLTIPKFTPTQFAKVSSSNNMQFKNGPLITHLNKILWPLEKYTKQDLLEYYETISGMILPYLRDRPISMHRHPGGINADSFFQKDLTGFIPSWFETIRISSTKKGFINYPLCQNEFSLLFLANMYCIELNPWMSCREHLENPDQVFIDLDPSEHNSFEEVVAVANHIRDILEKAKLSGFCKTSGSRGLHIMIPLIPDHSFAEARLLAKTVCEIVCARLPNLTSMERAKKKRKNKIYLDYMQNYYGQTLPSVYCVRPVAGALVSTPLLWKEVNEKLDPRLFNIKTIIPRLNKFGDIWYQSTKVRFDINNGLKNLKKIS